MKLLLLLLLPLSIFSQISLNNDDFSDGGDVVYVSTATNPALDFTSTGTNQNWDFSGLLSTGQKVKEYSLLDGASFLVNVTFGNFAGSDYQATNYTSSSAIPLDQISGFLPVSITDIFQFSKNTVDSITSVGLSMTVSGTEVPFKSDTVETRYKFPLQYGDVYNSRGYSNVDLNPVYNGIWRQYRQRYSEVDGWGTVTTPFGSFDVLRLHHTINEQDSLFVDFFGTATWIELPSPVVHEYEWIAQGQKEPILKVVTSEVGGNETITSIEYKDNSSANLNELKNNVSLHPNPVSELIVVSGVNSHAEYDIFDVSGRVVQSGILLSSFPNINVSNLSEGKYMVYIDQGGLIVVKSIVKK